MQSWLLRCNQHTGYTIATLIHPFASGTDEHFGSYDMIEPRFLIISMSNFVIDPNENLL